jgi:hypothetical protein
MNSYNTIQYKLVTSVRLIKPGSPRSLFQTATRIFFPHLTFPKPLRNRSMLLGSRHTYRQTDRQTEKDPDLERQDEEEHRQGHDGRFDGYDGVFNHFEVAKPKMTSKNLNCF